MSSAPVRIAIAGLGKIARDQHLPAIAGSDTFALVATVDPTSPPAGNTPHFADLDGLLASDIAVDAVAVCCPPRARAALARQALEAGKHVLLEKPPAATMAEAEALAALAEEQGVTIFAAWHSRFAAGVEPARAWLDGRTIRAVHIDWREDVRVWHPGQAWIFEQDGFGVFDPAINALSIATAILPEALTVHSATLDIPANCAAPIAGDVAMATASGVPVTMGMDFLQTGPQTWDITVETDAGVLTLSKGGSVLQVDGETLAGEDHEYPDLYVRFAECIAAGRSEIDLAPLALVEKALTIGERRDAPPFHE
ncbi:Gfo/Idh/MocA family protein [Erythrobacter sp. EC-HK427]|uniref:Gfo/Idh/MocA family protein n=1 Tax=Erythrobacter sp. EC-HK427 TaxID=2038396 RepID=UPI001252BA1C|nr:Gfo/Idh/MocA family oxidoreductase [Erythrobacter sp. EC-HK427]VVT01342.1 L-arabinose 1-dehydrogenase (NAD(P)(+)) [Erythrobacter sp. EC-HK427]